MRKTVVFLMLAALASSLFAEVFPVNQTRWTGMENATFLQYETDVEEYSYDESRKDGTDIQMFEKIFDIRMVDDVVYTIDNPRMTYQMMREGDTCYFNVLEIKETD